MIKVDIGIGKDKTVYSLIDVETGNLFELTLEEFNNLIEAMIAIKKKSKKKKKPFISSYEEIKSLGTSPRKALRIIGQYAIEKNIVFYSKEQTSEFVSRNIKAATVLQGLPGERIKRTIDYLKKNVDFKWTLETVIKYAEEIDNLSPPVKRGLGEFIIK